MRTTIKSTKAMTYRMCRGGESVKPALIAVATLAKKAVLDFGKLGNLYTSSAWLKLLRGVRASPGQILAPLISRLGGLYQSTSRR